MPFYDNPLKLDKRRKLKLVDDPIDMEYDIVDDLKPIWITNKRVPFKSVLKDLKDWQDRYAFRKFYAGVVRPSKFDVEMAIAVTPKYALRFCQGRARTGDDMFMCFAVSKDCTVICRLFDEVIPVAITKDATMRNMINRMTVRQFIYKLGANFQFFIAYR